MDVPDMVGERLGDERATTRVNVGGNDRVYVTTTRTLVYRAGGFLSNASVEEFTHDTDAFDVSAGRRQATFAFTYGEDVRGFTVPEERVETILTAVLSGILATTGVAAPEETILDTYCFSDRTLVVTDARVLVHGGETVWSAQYRAYAHADIEDVRFEQGASTPVVLVVEGQRRRIETPAEQARAVHRTLERAVAADHETGGRDTRDTIEAPVGSGDVENTVVAENGSASATAPVSDAPDDAKREPTPVSPKSEHAGRTDGAGEAHTPNVDGRAESDASARPREQPDSTGTDHNARVDPAESTNTEHDTAPETTTATPTGETSRDESATTTPRGSAAKAYARTESGVDDDSRDGHSNDEPADRSVERLDREALVAELDALAETVAHQRDLIERQHDRIERLSATIETE